MCEGNDREMFGAGELAAFPSGHSFLTPFVKNLLAVFTSEALDRSQEKGKSRGRKIKIILIMCVCLSLGRVESGSCRSLDVMTMV